MYHPAVVDDGVAAFQPGRWQRPCAAFLNQEVAMKCPFIHLLIDRRNMALRGLLSNGGFSSSRVRNREIQTAGPKVPCGVPGYIGGKPSARLA